MKTENTERMTKIALMLVKRMGTLHTLTEKEAAAVLEKMINTDERMISRLSEEAFETYVEIETSKIGRMVESEGAKGWQGAIQRYFARRKLENSLSEMGGRVGNLKLGQYKEAKALRKELDEFYKKTRKENPTLLEQNADRINGIEGDLMAILTDGQMGSTRKIMELERSGELKKYREEQHKLIREAGEGGGKKQKRRQSS